MNLKLKKNKIQIFKNLLLIVGIHIFYSHHFNRFKRFAVESYIVTTEDGYRLQLYRILSNTSKNVGQDNITNNKAVYIQHGLMDSSDAWVCNYPKYCLPYILLNRGFDVVIFKFTLVCR
jgi:hypothetical protein